MSTISRNLEQGGPYVNRWVSGQYTNRSPLYTPLTAMGLQMVKNFDILWDGLNVELSPQMTLVRRYGFSRFCSAAFGSSDWPLGYSSFKNLSGTIKLLVDTPTKVVNFTTSAQTTVFTKGTTQQTFFQKVGSTVYMCNGTDLKKWNQTTASNWGIVAPVAAPSLSFSPGALSPIVGYKYVFVYVNSSTGHPSTASPVSASTGPQTSKNITIQGASSSDTQVDKVDIYRNDDGGSLFYFLARVNNGGTWSYADSTPDSGLNDDIVAPTAHTNDPPPSGASLVCFHMGRLWVAANNIVYFAGGPDTTNGVPEEAFPPANNFKFPGKVTAMASTSAGLIVFTSSDSFVIQGQSTVSFWASPWQKNFGVQSQNCVAQDGDLLFLYTSNRQLFTLPSVDEIGFAVADQLAASFDPATSYLALHRHGNDQGLWISDGSTRLRRYSLATQAWDVEHRVVGGAGAIASMEASTATYKLFTGRTAGTGYILARDTTTYQDDGSSYTAFATLGEILAPAGKTEEVTSIHTQTMPVGTYPTISVLLNEISGTFVALPNPVRDPAKLVPASSTVLMNRHWFKAAQTPLPQLVMHMQVKITFATENFRNEVLGLAIS
jgi:hypothetical protein